MIIVTSRDVNPHDQVTKIAELFQVYSAPYEDLRQEQVNAWKDRWALADVIIEGDAAAQQGIRFTYSNSSRLIMEKMNV